MADFVGLDIGTSTIKGVQVKNKTLVSYKISPAPEVSILSENPTDLQKIVASLDKFFEGGDFKVRNVVTSVPESQVFTRVVTLPRMEEAEITGAIQNEAQQYIPMPLERITYDYEVLGESETQANQIDVLLIAVPKTLTQKYFQVLKDANLNPLSLETETIALSRSVLGDSTAPVMIVSIGASTTDISIFSRGAVRFTRSVSTGGKTLERALVQAFNLEPGQAAEYVRTYGLEERLGGKVLAAIKPVFDIIVEELKRAQAFFSSRSGRPIGRVVLVGGTANLPGVIVYLADVLGIEVARGNPWQTISVPSGFAREVLEEHAPSLAVAAGLALKEL